MRWQLNNRWWGHRNTSTWLLTISSCCSSIHTHTHNIECMPNCLRHFSSLWLHCIKTDDDKKKVVFLHAYNRLEWIFMFCFVYSPNPIAAQQRTVTTDKTTLRLVIECWGRGFRSQHRVIKYNNKPKREIMRRPTGIEQKIPKLCGWKRITFLSKLNSSTHKKELLLMTTFMRWHTFLPLLY